MHSLLASLHFGEGGVVIINLLCFGTELALPLHLSNGFVGFHLIGEIKVLSFPHLFSLLEVSSGDILVL